MIPFRKVESLAACQMNEQQIADVLDIDLSEVKKDVDLLRAFREAIRKGNAKGEAEIRSALYQRARKGDTHAYELLKRRADKNAE
ncbi:hypothetical protein ACOZXQ_000575 [Cronobacter malonaticus]